MVPQAGIDAASDVNGLVLRKLKLMRSGFMLSRVGFDADPAITSWNADMELAANKLKLTVTSE